MGKLYFKKSSKEEKINYQQPKKGDHRVSFELFKGTQCH